MENLLPDGISALKNQGGGHMFNYRKGMVGIMQHQDGSLLKPVCPDADEQIEDDEVRFYEKATQEQDHIHKGLRKIIPRFHGTQMVKLGDRQVLCMKVENFTHGFKRACVLDMKMGKVTTIPTAPEEKRLHEASKYLGTRDPFGFSIPGMSVYDVTAAKPVQLGKSYGKALTKDTTIDAFRLFLNADCKNAVRPICESLLAQLEDIRQWFETQRKYVFFASSILMTYDAAPLEAAISDSNSPQTPDTSGPPASSTDAFLKHARPMARMIDFAHAWPAEGQEDIHYMEGLKSVIQLVTDVKNSLV